jgi:D-alanine-D-alanine ligase
VDGPNGARALPPSEVRMDPGRAFDFAGKYLGKWTREITPAEVSPEVTRAAQELALAAHRALGCVGYSRTDMIVGPQGPVFLELNTLPGLTRMSFIPQQLAAEGTPMLTFLQGQIELAKQRRG